jgi:hypothetical protein
MKERRRNSSVDDVGYYLQPNLYLECRVDFQQFSDKAYRIGSLVLLFGVTKREGELPL